MLENKLKNIIGAVFIILLSYFFYKTNATYFNIFNTRILFNLDFLGIKQFSLAFMGSFFGKWGIINYFIFVYSLGFILYYSFFGSKLGKSVAFWIGLRKLLKKIHPKYFNEKIISPEEKLAILSVLVKVIYIPLMLLWVFQNGTNFFSYFGRIIALDANLNGNFYSFYYGYLHAFFLNFLFFIDIAVFFVGYTVEFDFLKNKIKSVEPTLLGWVVALMCYPAFNSVSGIFFARYSSNDPIFTTLFGENNISMFLSVFFGFCILAFFSVYVWASVALGFKASNLTNRGIVSSGPYAIIRHPAYMSKNISRIIGAFPILFYNIYKTNFFMIFFIIFSLFLRVLVYHLRALTEERHLLMDPEYQEYCQKVKYMYIPGII